jgi:hypothetical protein
MSWDGFVWNIIQDEFATWMELIKKHARIGGNNVEK